MRSAVDKLLALVDLLGLLRREIVIEGSIGLKGLESKSEGDVVHDIVPGV